MRKAIAFAVLVALTSIIPTLNKSSRTSASVIQGDQNYLVGDWDGNGTDTLAVRRRNHILRNNTWTDSAATTEFVFGGAGAPPRPPTPGPQRPPRLKA
jgi:hypothetical protein